MLLISDDSDIFRISLIRNDAQMEICLAKLRKGFIFVRRSSHGNKKNTSSGSLKKISNLPLLSVRQTDKLII
jgi:hypothetical protein